MCIENDDDVCLVLIFGASSNDGRLELVHQVLDHLVEVEYDKHWQEFSQYLNSKQIKRLD